MVDSGAMLKSSNVAFSFAVVVRCLPAWTRRILSGAVLARREMRWRREVTVVPSMIGREIVSPERSLTKMEKVFSGWRTAACWAWEDEEEPVEAERERDMVRVSGWGDKLGRWCSMLWQTAWECLIDATSL